MKDKEVKEKELKEKDFKETLSENGNGDDNEESEFLDQFTTHDTFLSNLIHLNMLLLKKILFFFH